jgi:hypothetical protein
MPTVTLTFEPRIGVGSDTFPVENVAGMLDMIDEHDTAVLANSQDDATSMVMLSDDGRTAWYVVTLPELAADGLDVQVDTFTLTPETFHIVNLDHGDGTGGAGRVRCECGTRTFTTTDPTDVERFVGTFTCTVCTQPWETRNIVQRLRAVLAL